MLLGIVSAKARISKEKEKAENKQKHEKEEDKTAFATSTFLSWFLQFGS